MRCFEFVDDEMIGVGKCAESDFTKAGMFSADHIDASHEAMLFGILKSIRGVCLSVTAKGIEGVEQGEVTEMKNAGVCFGEVEVFDIEEAVGSALMEEGASARAVNRHGIGVGRGAFGGGMKLGGVDAAGLAVLENPAAVVVVTDEATGFERIVDLHGGKILEDVVGTAAVGLRFREDVGEGVLLGVDIDDLDLIDDEISGGEDSLAFHG